jgi:hypothetical protein
VEVVDLLVASMEPLAEAVVAQVAFVVLYLHLVAELPLNHLYL